MLFSLIVLRLAQIPGEEKQPIFWLIYLGAVPVWVCSVTTVWSGGGRDWESMNGIEFFTILLGGMLWEAIGYSGMLILCVPAIFIGYWFLGRTIKGIFTASSVQTDRAK